MERCALVRVGTAKNENASAGDGQAALPYLHEFVTRLPDTRVLGTMGSFAQRWRFRYLIDCPDSRVLPVLAAPHSSSRARISNPRFEQDILAAMAKAAQSGPIEAAPERADDQATR